MEEWEHDNGGDQDGMDPDGRRKRDAASRGRRGEAFADRAGEERMRVWTRVTGQWSDQMCESHIAGL